MLTMRMAWVVGTIILMGLSAAAGAFYKHSSHPNGGNAVIPAIEITTGRVPQTERATGVAKLLPPGAVIVERADLSSAVGKPRALVLWMLNPRKVVRDATHEYTCPEQTTGNYLSGPTRLSLIDASQQTVLNTVGVHRGINDDTFDIPYLIKRFYYQVPSLGASGEGRPVILNLGDYNSDGIATELVLYDARDKACGEVETTMIGYSGKSDAIVHYPVESSNEKGETSVNLWAGPAFAKEAARLGYAKFSWAPRHGSSEVIQVAFDPARQLFVSKSHLPNE